MLNTTNNNTAPLSDAEVLQASAASAANTASEATLELHEAQERLAQELAVFRGCTVALAFSGGTDSSLLLKLLTQQKQQYVDSTNIINRLIKTSSTLRHPSILNN